jgi:2-haloalkanoic acid dehalogenase type II
MLRRRIIRAITLDLDDTLWPVAPAIERAERRAHERLAEHAPRVAAEWPPERLRELRLSLYEARPDLRHDYLLLRRLALEQAFAQSGSERRRRDSIIGETLEAFMAARNEVELYPEVTACLERLSRRFPLASVTNGNADLSRIGLDHLFRATVSAHVHGTGKPDPRIFHIACRELGCAPQEVVHLGDDAELDVRGARAAGMHAVWINRAGNAWRGDDPPVVVADLIAFERWLEENGGETSGLS